MGWMRTLLLGDIGNRLDIADTERSVSYLEQDQQRTRRELHERELQIANLKDEVERQKLAIQALTRFLVHKELIDEQELEDFIEEVDGEDGVVDGKMSVDISGRPRLVYSSKKKVPKDLYPKI